MPYTLLKQSPTRYSGRLAPGQIIICHLPGNSFTPWVVWWENLENGGRCSGDYYVSREEAELSLHRRLKPGSGVYRMDGSAQAQYEIVSHNYAPFNAAVAKYIEKLEQPDPRVVSQAFREKARGVGYVLGALGVLALLTLIGVSLVVWQWREPARTTEGAGVPPKWPGSVPEPPPPGNPEKVVTNYTLFTAVNVSEGVDIVTGWNFAKSTDNKPEFQYCHLRTPDELGNHIIGIAHRSQSGALIWQASPSSFNDIAREIDYETALTKCRWFPN